MMLGQRGSSGLPGEVADLGAAFMGAGSLAAGGDAAAARDRDANSPRLADSVLRRFEQGRASRGSSEVEDVGAMRS